MASPRFVPIGGGLSSQPSPSLPSTPLPQSPGSPRFVPIQRSPRFVPIQRGSRSSSPSFSSPHPPSSPRSLQNALAFLRLGSLGAGLGGAPGLGAGLGGLSSLLGAIQGFRGGNIPQGALGTLGAGSAGLRLAAPLLPASQGTQSLLGTTGSALGGIGSLFGGGLQISQGNTLGGLGSLAGGGAHLANLAGQSGAGTALGTVGTGLNVASGIQNILSRDDRRLGGGIGNLAGAAIGTAVFPGLGTAIGGALGGLVGGLFGGKVPHYFAVRQHALDVGGGGISDYGSVLQKALKGNDINAVQAALARGPANNHIRADLRPPQNVIHTLGWPSGMTSFSDLNAPQFQQLLNLWAGNPTEVNKWITGSGDVPYLPQKQAQALASRTQKIATSVLTALTGVSLPSPPPPPPSPPPPTSYFPSYFFSDFSGP